MRPLYTPMIPVHPNWPGRKVTRRSRRRARGKLMSTLIVPLTPKIWVIENSPFRFDGSAITDALREIVQRMEREAAMPMRYLT